MFVDGDATNIDYVDYHKETVMSKNPIHPGSTSVMIVLSRWG